MRIKPLRRRRISVLGASFGLLVAVALPSSCGRAAEGDIRHAGEVHAIPGRYIVVLKDSTATTPKAFAKRFNGQVTHTYSNALRGYAAEMSERDARRTAADPAVAYVEQDREVRALGTQSPTPSWGLDRIDQRDLPLNDSYTYPNTGSNVTAYIIDTGIRISHDDFGGRAVHGRDTVDNDNDASDCNGHGTHVAGTVGGSSYGVAKGVRLIGVRVLDCDGSGTLSGVAAGVDWVTAHHTSGPAVANVSLGALGSSRTLEDAVRNSIADGVTYAIASGNSSLDACNFTPARVSEAITVNSIDKDDSRSAFSNYGSCTDVFAPGRDITSAWHTSDTATNTISGTSMASPHVAGGAALYLSANPSASPATVQTALKNNATKNAVRLAGPGSPNNLLYVGFLGGGGDDPVEPEECSARNGTNVAIPDAGRAVYSRITIADCEGAASTESRVTVDIEHSWRGDLVIDLVASDGTRYRLKNANYEDYRDDVKGTYTVNLSAEPAEGPWWLQVRDVYRYDTGYIDSWTFTV